MEYPSNSPYYAYRRHQRKKEPTNFEIVKGSLKTISKEYCTESSICGLKHLVDENTPYIERYARSYVEKLVTSRVNLSSNRTRLV